MSAQHYRAIPPNPSPQGGEEWSIYDPALTKASCGVGFIADIISLSPNLRRKLWLASVTGLSVGVGGLGLFMTRGTLPKVSALAPIHAFEASRLPHRELNPAVAKPEVENGKAPCQDKLIGSNASCDSSPVRKPIGALNERPAIAAVSISHTDGAPAVTALDAPATINAPPVVNVPRIASTPAVVNAPPVEDPPFAAAAEKPASERAASPPKTKSSPRVAVTDRPHRPPVGKFGRAGGKLHSRVRQRMDHYNLRGLEERLGSLLTRALAQFLR
jgi:hypothetical protein